MGDDTSRRLLDDYAKRHGTAARLGCSTVAHRDLGYCSGCLSPHDDGKTVGAARELAGWRLLAMAERGVPPWPS